MIYYGTEIAYPPQEMSERSELYVVCCQKMWMEVQSETLAFRLSHILSSGTTFNKAKHLNIELGNINLTQGI